MKERTQKIIIWLTTMIIGALILVVVMIPAQMNAYEQYYEKYGEYPDMINEFIATWIYFFTCLCAGSILGFAVLKNTKVLK